MTNANILEALRELHDVLVKARVLVEGSRILRDIDGLADAAPDLEIGEAVADRPDLLPKLIEHAEKQDRYREIDDQAEALLNDAFARLERLTQSVESTGRAGS